MEHPQQFSRKFLSPSDIKHLGLYQPGSIQLPAVPIAVSSPAITPQVVDTSLLGALIMKNKVKRGSGPRLSPENMDCNRTWHHADCIQAPRVLLSSTVPNWSASQSAPRFSTFYRLGFQEANTHRLSLTSEGLARVFPA